MVRTDGSAGDADYGAIGTRYAQYRQPDRQIAAQIHAALGDARSVVNVGAGAGSYEPENRLVTPVEPSATMRAQRPTKAAVAIDATAEELPSKDKQLRRSDGHLHGPSMAGSDCWSQANQTRQYRSSRDPDL